MNLIGPISTGATAGGAGTSTATVTTTSIVSGLVYAVYVKFSGTAAPATTDVTITTLGTSPNLPAQTILSSANANTSGYFYPRTAVHLNTSAAAISGGYGLVPVHDRIVVTIAQSDDASVLDVWLLMDDSNIR